MFRRSRQPVTDPSPSLQIDPIGLVEPVYLDVDMLQTYVAALQNGVTYVVRETRRSDIERTREVKAGFTVPVLSASVGAGGSILGRDTSRQTKDFERSHTPSSLFVSLRASLVFQRNAVRAVKSGEDAAGLLPGDLVEVSGELIADPLVTVLDALADSAQLIQDLTKVKVLAEIIDQLARQQMGPTVPSLFARMTPTSASSPPGRQQAQPSRGGSPQQVFSLSEALGQGATALDTIRTKVKQGAVADYVMEGPDDVRVVLPLSRKCLAEGREHQIEGGVFTVLGTVTRNLGRGEAINLVRRSAFGALPREWIERGHQYMRQSSLNLSLPDLIIRPPALQLLPLAIFA